MIVVVIQGSCMSDLDASCVTRERDESTEQIL